jgi:hypothetical protein
MYTTEDAAYNSRHFLSIDDADYGDDADVEPVCICPDYAGAKHPAFCVACNGYTDDIEIAAAEAAQQLAEVA